LRINPEYVDAWFNLGICYKASSKTAKLMEVYNRLKALDPASADRFFNKVVLP
jgi:tetratricopeptide (TPR) repeat protein